MSTVILGDTNFYHFLNKIFLFRKDKMSYGKLMLRFKDTNKGLNFTSTLLTTFDKIFISKELSYHDFKIVKDKFKYMDHYLVTVNIITYSN